MKREILCSDCFRKTILGRPNNEQISYLEAVEMAMERIRVKRGASKLTCRCDHCSRPIHSGDKVICRSLWIEGQPVVDWEDIYIKVSI